MGRYYNTGNFSGKFWFAVQPSDDPETVYGMGGSPEIDDEDEETGCMDYHTDNGEYVRKQLDRQYAILGVDPKDRLYVVKEEGEIDKYFDETINKIIYTEEEPEEPACGYYMGDGKPTMYAVSDEYMLAASRVDLGIKILSDITNEGECWLTAEF